MALEVGTGIDQDKGSDTADQKREDQCQAINHEIQRDAESGHPLVTNQKSFTAADRRDEADKIGREQCGEKGQHPANVFTCHAIERGNRHSQQKSRKHSQ